MDDATDLRNLPVLRYYEERRGYPRVPADRPALVQCPNGDIVRARVRNVSPEGLQIRTDAETAGRLDPGGAPIRPEARPDVRIAFSLFVRDRRETIVARGDLTYIAAVRHDEIAFGYRFTEIDDDTRRSVDAFLLDSLMPVEVARAVRRRDGRRPKRRK